MKKLLKLFSMIIAVCLFQAAFADASLKIKVVGTSKNNTYFLCVNSNGCMSMYAAAHGKVFPLDSGKVDRIFMVNAKNLRMYPQTLPASCNIDVNDHQTLIVSGTIVQAGGDAQISGLRCRVS